VHDIFGHWTLSKGKIGDAPRSPRRSGHVREIKEEIGLDIEPSRALGENEYVANDPATGKKRKHVTYFLAESPFAEVTSSKKGGLDDARWFKLQTRSSSTFMRTCCPIVKGGEQKMGAQAKAKAKKKNNANNHAADFKRLSKSWGCQFNDPTSCGRLLRTAAT
jgi:ADP-ribose pyrophosphatase YjhB (NUDIX family)